MAAVMAALAQDFASAPAASRTISGSGTPAAAWLAAPALAAVPLVPLDALLPLSHRLVVVAPHPDDEVLACGALIAMAAARGNAVLVVAVTDGDASHPGSRAWTPARLRAERPRESARALATLGAASPGPGPAGSGSGSGSGNISIVRLALGDGAVSAAEAALADRLAALFGPEDTVVTTWRYDGHPDHEACSRACARSAAARGARLLEAPVWGLHWAAPDEAALPLAHARRLAVDDATLARKRAALACFDSQIDHDSSVPAVDGTAPVAPIAPVLPVLPHWALARALLPFELYFAAAAP